MFVNLKELINTKTLVLVHFCWVITKLRKNVNMKISNWTNLAKSIGFEDVLIENIFCIKSRRPSSIVTDLILEPLTKMVWRNLLGR